MKKFTVILSIVLGLWATNGWAGNNGTDAKVHYIKSPRLARALVEKWIAEYEKVEPTAQFRVASGSDAADLQVVLTGDAASLQDGQHKQTIYFGEYAILPITSRSSEAERVLEGKRLNGKKVKEIFFLGDEFDDTKKRDKQLEKLTVYSGNGVVSVARAFAANFGEETSSFRGKRISGDDAFVNVALSKDPNGIGFNALSNIYDLESRRLKDGLSLVGLDLKKDLSERINNASTIDEVLVALEQTETPLVPVERIGLSYDGFDPAVQQFLVWVLTSGRAFNHDFGLLSLGDKLANEQVNKVKSLYTAQK